MMTGLKFPGLFSSPSPLLMKFRPEKLKNQKAKCSKKQSGGRQHFFVFRSQTKAKPIKYGSFITGPLQSQVYSDATKYARRNSKVTRDQEQPCLKPFFLKTSVRKNQSIFIIPCHFLEIVAFRILEFEISRDLDVPKSIWT